MFLLLFLSLFLQTSLANSSLFLNNLTPNSAITITSQTSMDNLGASVKNAGDFNGDGLADIIIGAYGTNQESGAAYILFGGLSGLSDLDITAGVPTGRGVIITGANFGDNLGYSVSSAGDFNGDGIDDVLIGAYKFDGSRGIACVIYGSKTPPAQIDLAAGIDPIQGLVIIGANPADLFGISVSYAGDVNNDKIDDVIIGASDASNHKGAAYVIFGRKDNPGYIFLSLGLGSNEGFLIQGVANNDFLGYCVSNAGDIDGDGVADLIVGAVGPGIAYVIFGKSGPGNTLDLSQGLSSSQGFRIVGNPQGARVVSSAGDLNNDGFDDVVIGAAAENSYVGAAYVVFGKARNSLSEVNTVSGMSMSVGVKIKGVAGEAGMFGLVLNGARDLNGDKIDDLLIGAPGMHSQAGAAYVLFGSKTFGASEIDLTSGLDSKKGFSIIGDQTGDYAGVSASFAGDVNGDGRIDIIVGAFGAHSNAGAAYLLFEFPTGSPVVICPQNCLTCEQSSVCKICEPGYALFPNGQCSQCPAETDLVNGICVPKKTTLDTATEVAGGLFDSGSTASRLFTMGRSLSVGLGLMAKIIQNVRFLNISYPPEAQSAFESYGTDLFELPIPEILYEPPETKGLSVVYEKYDMSPTFLENYWPTIMTILMSLAGFLLVKLVQYLTRKQSKSHILQVALKNIAQTTANFLVIQIYSNLDDVIFFWLLDISSTKMNSSSAGISMGVAVFFLLLGFALVFFHCWLLGKYQQAKNQGSLEKFEKKYRIFGTLFDDFKDDSAMKQSFFGVLILRCVILVLVIVLLQPPWIQASVLNLANLLFLAYFIYQRPFKSLFDEISQYFCEATIFAAYLSVLVLSISDYRNEGTESMRSSFGKCIVFAGIVLALGGFIIQLIQIVGVVIGICKFLKGYNRRAQVSISLSLEESQVRNMNEGVSQMSENSEILRQKGRSRLVAEQVELDQISGRGRIVAKKGPNCLKISERKGLGISDEKGLEISYMKNDGSGFLEKKSSSEVLMKDLRNEGGDSYRVLKSKRVQISSRHNTRDLSGESGVGLTEINSSVRRKKIKRIGTRGSRLPGFDDDEEICSGKL